MSPETRADRALLALLDGHAPERVIFTVHQGAPKPKARPRFGGHVYTPTSTTTAENALAWCLKRDLRGHRFEGEVAIALVFVLPDRRRVDADNLAKMAMDAATKAGAWIDDSQVTAQTVRLELDQERPRTIVMMADKPPALGRKPPKPKSRRAAKRNETVSSVSRKGGLVTPRERET